MIGTAIKETRLHYGLSIRQLARQADVSAATILSLENGQDCRLSIAHKVALQLGMTISVGLNRGASNCWQPNQTQRDSA